MHYKLTICKEWRGIDSDEPVSDDTLAATNTFYVTCTIVHILVLSNRIIIRCTPNYIHINLIYKSQLITKFYYN